jgi:hypothetical protein
VGAQMTDGRVRQSYISDPLIEDALTKCSGTPSDLPGAILEQLPAAYNRVTQDSIERSDGRN